MTYYRSMQIKPRRFVILGILLALPLVALAQQPPSSLLRMSIPGVPVTLELNYAGAQWDVDVREDGLEVKGTAVNEREGVMITAFLQKVGFPASAEKCRSEWWSQTKQVKIKRKEEREYSQDNLAVVEFIVPEFEGQQIHSKNVHAYIGSRDLCAEIHMSKQQFTAADQKLLDDVLSSVRLLPDESVPQPAQQRSSMQYVAEGSRYYLQKNYRAAAETYQKALDMEKQNRTLDSTIFRVLVDNLGMAYGINGELDKAMETFSYGITQDPEYPLFYYNVACTYGEMGKMDESLQQLRLAYKYRKNVIPGEKMPDPLKDDSFRKFIHDKTFVDAVHEMKKL